MSSSASVTSLTPSIRRRRSSVCATSAWLVGAAGEGERRHAAGRGRRGRRAGRRRSRSRRARLSRSCRSSEEIDASVAARDRARGRRGPSRSASRRAGSLPACAVRAARRSSCRARAVRRSPAACCALAVSDATCAAAARDLVAVRCRRAARGRPGTPSRASTRVCAAPERPAPTDARRCAARRGSG